MYLSRSTGIRNTVLPLLLLFSTCTILHLDEKQTQRGQEFSQGSRPLTPHQPADPKNLVLDLASQVLYNCILVCYSLGFSFLIDDLRGRAWSNPV